MSNHKGHKYNRIIYTVLMVMITLSVPVTAETLSSIRLKDTIKKGVGSINLLKGQGNKNISLLTLEQLRLNNGGSLILGVDVNEAASGSEKASSQGVAIDSLTLTVSTNSGVTKFTSFSTQTQSMLASEGNSSRSEYYTLIGRTGSNNITGSGLNGTSFDSTLSIPINMSLANVTSIHLSITLLDTNASLGDPETFYDYSAGFEDLAILTKSDVSFLDDEAAGRNEAPLVIVTDQLTAVVAKLHYPSSTDYYIVAYEDEYPNKGDYDLNDLVVAYRVTLGLDETGKVKTISGSGYLVARGGLYDHDWHLRIPIFSDTRSIGQFSLYSPPDSELTNDRVANIDVTNDLDITIFSNTTTLFTDPSYLFVNTVPLTESIPGEKFSFDISLENSISINNIGAAPFDPYLFVNSTAYEIHLSDHYPININSINIANGDVAFTDDSGYPFAFIFPEGWKNPLERVDVGLAYPELLDFILSDKKSSKDWYLNGVDEHLTNHGKSQWKW